MIAVTATVRPHDSLQVLHLLGQCFRRHFESLPILGDQLLVRVPSVGHVLVTEELARTRLDVVVSDEASVDATITALEEEVRRQVRHQSLSIEWTRSAFVPTALR